MDQLQQKTLDMQRGLFLIKYESSETSREPPTVRISPEDGSENAIELILAPDADEAVLWSPGASLVARAVRSGRLRVVVAPAQPNGSTAARIQVVTLSQDPGGAREVPREPVDVSGYRVLGHVAGRGDIVVDADNWIAGPQAPTRIEGFAIQQWPSKRQDLSLRYGVTVGGPRPVIGPLVEVGDFAGTRGRALPIVGATLELSGSAAHSQQLVVNAIFLGSPQMTVTGQRVVLSGPTGREPLVGLKIKIESAERSQLVRPVSRPSPVGQVEASEEFRPARELAPVSEVQQEMTSKRSAAVSSPMSKRSGRVRVFRSQIRKSR
jgi:hypothetical protein